MQRPFRLALFATGIACAAGTALVPALTPFPPPPLVIWSLNIAAGLSLAVVGFILMGKRPASQIGWLMGIAAILFFPFALSWFRSPFLWTLSTLTVSLYLAVAAHLVIVFPDGRVRARFDWIVIVTIYCWAIATNFALLALFDARDYGERGFPRNLVLLYGDRGARDFLSHAVDRGNLLLGLVVVAIFVRRWTRTTTVERRVFAPLALALAVALLAFLVRTGGDIVHVSDRVAAALDYSEPTVWIVIAAGFLAGVLRSQIGRAAVGDLVVDMRSSADPEQLRTAVARTLTDPSLELVHWNAEVGRYVDAAGGPVELPDEGSQRMTTVIEGEDGPLAALLHDRVIEQEEPKLLESVAAAARLGLENRRLSHELTLSRELPTGLAERLWRDGHRVGDTETLDVTVLTSDVRGYSTIAERADPHSLARQLNEHRRAMTDVIAGDGGTVMQFVGDEVFAVFGAPVALSEHASRAVHSARAMQAAQAAINKRWLELGLPPFALGIGLSSGEVAAALLGSEEHVEYSIVGDTVNLAQRLQQWADSGEIVISANTFGAACDLAEVEPLAPATVKGREALVSAFRLRVREDHL